MPKAMRKNSPGYSLLEMLVVISLLAAVAFITTAPIPMLSRIPANAW